MVFDSGYYNALDRGYYAAFEPEKMKFMDYSLRAAREGVVTPYKAPVYDVDEIGASVTEGRQFGTFRQSIQTAIRMGAGQVEIQFQAEGSDKQVGAEAYGHEHREELRELARVNNITLSAVHAPSQIGNLSGFAGPQQGFSDQQRKVHVEEIKKAIHFAGDVTKGGAVVVHTGEWQRPMTEADWNVENDRYKFRTYMEEDERAIVPVVDRRTGNILTQVRKNQVVARAQWQKADKDFTYVSDVDNEVLGIKKGETVHVAKGDYINYEGEKLDFSQRVPSYNPGTGLFNVEQLRWNDFVDEARIRNERKASEMGITVDQLKSQHYQDFITPEEAFLIATTDTQERVARGWALQYSMRTDKLFDQINKLKKLRKMYEKIESSADPEEREMMKKQARDIYGDSTSGLIEPGYIDTTELIDNRLKDLRENIMANREMVTGQLQSAEEQKILRAHAESIGKYALRQSMKSFVEAGIYAMDISKEKQCDRPIFVAPENIFPEMGYGSHPEELIEMVQQARSHMADELVKMRGMNEEAAKKAAADHIKATFDTQHLGMWKKNMVQKPDETPEQFDKRFKGWYMDQVAKLQESGVLGHIHLVDAMGSGHHHLPAGQGNLPVVETLKYLKEKGYKGAITSEAHEESPADRQLTKTWEALGSPIFSGPRMTPSSMIGPGPTGWSDVYQSYFGRTQSPYFTFGGYSPSEDWTLWSGVRME